MGLIGRIVLLLSLAVAAARPAAAACAGDCDGSGDVTIDEIILGVSIAQGAADLSTCAAADADDSSDVTVDDIVAAVTAALTVCVAAPTPTPTAIPEEACPNRDPLRQVYFGDLHVHTANSFDAYFWDVRTKPSDAYRFARGEPLALPPLDATGAGTRTVQLTRPLDFAAVTDHSEFLGEIETCTTPGSPSYDSPTCRQVRTDTSAAYVALGSRLTLIRPRRVPDICGTDNQICLSAAMPVWTRVQEAAAAAYDRCQFTSFVAYEYSRSPAGSTMHRNVIFRNDRVPFPISAFEQPTPLGLWRELQHTCRDAGTGCDVLAIPHNSNESAGRTFFVEYPGATSIVEEQEQARLRAATEPLLEIYQHKGDSECMNGLSGIAGAPDEQCDFEKRRRPPFEDCGDGVGQLGAVDLGCVSRRDFARGALLAGLTEGARLGVNPYRLGFVGSTDTHNGTPGNVDERSFIGHEGIEDGATPALLLQNITYSPGALTGAWAEENSRSAIFEALRRKEVFATSGPRITARVFGGWNLPTDLCSNPDLVRLGYESGVPMGGILPARPANATAPAFVVAALRDAGTAAQPGTPLQRLQVIKGWIANGVAQQRVYDIAGTAEGATVDVETCNTSGAGADTLCTVWTDPNFDPTEQAFYYVRVLENPTCRWSTWLCNRLSAAERPSVCDDPAIPKTIQERAWTSPIWYEPSS